jgi:hypothetical protein
MIFLVVRALMGKMDKLSTRIIRRHDILSHKEKKIKNYTIRIISPLNESVVKNSNDDDEDDDDDVVNNEMKSRIHHNLLYETQPRESLEVDFGQIGIQSREEFC